MNTEKLPVLTPQHFGSLVFDPWRGSYFPFDHESTALLLRTQQQSFYQLLAETNERDRRAVAAFFHEFSTLGFFSLDGFFAGSVRGVRDVPTNHLVAPLVVHLEVVAACNLFCTHCFAGDLPRKERPLSLEELRVFFAELSSLGCFHLSCSGGEPLLRKDLCAVLDAAIDADLHPAVTTNGLLLDESWVGMLSERTLRWFNVSLEGATATTNDAIRGTGSFARVLEKVSLLRGRVPFSLAFTVTKQNVAELKECAQLAERLGAETVVFRPLYPTGTALLHPELMATYQQYREALESLQFPWQEASALEPFVEGGASVFSEGSCGAGTTVCSVSVGGVVSPCSFLGEDFAAGSLREKPFRYWWNESQRFRSMREQSAFEGGCRARSLAYAGSAFERDPWIEGTENLQGEVLVPLRRRNA